MEIINVKRLICGKCSKPHDEWSTPYHENGEKTYCCEGCANNAGCTCDMDNEDYLLSRSFG